MYLLIDWGNTQIKYLTLNSLTELTALADSPLSQNQKYNIASSLNKLTTQLEQVILNKQLNQVLIASVRCQDDTNRLINQLKKFEAGIFVAETGKLDCGVTCAYSNHRRLGIDRWLTIIAGHNDRYAVGVIDIGTAITLDVVDSIGLHLGGHILPGKKLLIDSLSNTANVNVEEKIDCTTSFELGNTTDECVNYGITQMIIGYLYHTVNQATAEHKVKKWLLVGGGGEWAKTLFVNYEALSKSEFITCPQLLFSGLAKLYIQSLRK